MIRTLMFAVAATMWVNACTPVVAAAPVPPPKPLQPVTVFSVYDGDSFRIRDGASSIPIRVMGLDTPELRQVGSGRPVPLCETALADRARSYATRLLMRLNAQVEIKAVRADRYGRLLAWVFVDGAPFDQLMIEAGHGRVYDGGQRGVWC